MWAFGHEAKEQSPNAKDRETKSWIQRKTQKAGLSLRGAASDEAISVFGQRLLRYTRNDTETLGHAVEVLSHSTKGGKCP